MNFLADDIAEDEKDEKRMKKGKKDAEKSKSMRGEKSRLILSYLNLTDYSRVIECSMQTNVASTRFTMILF